MARQNGIVSRRVRLDIAADRPADEAIRSRQEVSVELDDGRRVRLDGADERSQGRVAVLAGLEKLGRPVYLEVDPETDAVTRLLIPHVARIVSIRQSDAGYDVALDVSHARHSLARDNPDFAEFEGLLRDALARRTPVIVTEDDDHNILDIRLFTPGPDDPPLPPWPGDDVPPDRRGPRGGLFSGFRRWRIWPWRWRYGCISMARAQQVFDAMSATTCDPLTVPAPCIPFLYPDDGCWARAHEMCRLMIADFGLSPRKVWISGNLHTLTRNNPNCFVDWGWHVAPTLCVYRRRPWWLWWWWWWRGETMVVDPSLFATPVSAATWKSVQGDPGATLTYTDWTDYLWGATDPTFAQTNHFLAVYRLQLLNRSNGPAGPPPYAHCP
ncbi:MAG TPA: protein-glutamine glutaminase family protein [Allosphingosinicella sp.]|nr:protein-glutamine glutaminase family protein [Allosphingosinicella sp.]